MCITFAHVTWVITLKNRIMKELKCPKCGNIFKVDEADYASILNQVKTKEIEGQS